VISCADMMGVVFFANGVVQGRVWDKRAEVGVRRVCTLATPLQAIAKVKRGVEKDNEERLERIYNPTR
jgi:hypothetical protein